MTNIVPSIEAVAYVPTTTAAQLLPGSKTIPTGAKGRTLSGIEVINGITASNTTAAIVKVYKTSVAAENLLATVTLSATQAAWTGVYAGIVPSATVSNQFDEGDVLILYQEQAATSATTGQINLFWE